MAHQLRKVMLGLFLVGVAAHSPADQGNDASSGAVFMGDFPAVSGKGALTVSGNGYHHRELYEDGEVPFLSPCDDTGQCLPDGIYQFNFISTPEGSSRSARQREVLRGDNSGSVQKGTAMATHLSGTFEVSDQQLIYR